MNPGTVVLMAVMTLIAILGLLLSSRAVDEGMLLFGYVLFLLGVFLNFFLIKRHFDRTERP